MKHSTGFTLSTVAALITMFAAPHLSAAPADGSCEEPFSYSTAKGKIKDYASGIYVTNDGLLYRCVDGDNGAFCSQEAFEPGGIHSDTAWDVIVSCDAGSSSSSSSSSASSSSTSSSSSSSSASSSSSSSSSGSSSSSSSSGSDGSLNLSQQPLLNTTSGKPNVLFIVDNSASMMNMLPETPYNYPSWAGGDGAAHAFSCEDSDATVLDTDAYYEFQMDAVGDAGLNVTGTAQIIQWTFKGKNKQSATLSFGPNGGDHCFGDQLNYKAFLGAYGGTTGTPQWNAVSGGESLGGFAEHSNYVGHYLNFYFANSTFTGPLTQISDDYASYGLPKNHGANHFGQSTRLDVITQFLYGDIGLFSSGGAMIDAAKVSLATFQPDYTLFTPGIENSSTTSNLRILAPFVELDGSGSGDHTAAAIGLGANYNPGYDFGDPGETSAGDKYPRANTSLARGLKQAARYFLEDGSSTAGDIELTSSGAITAAGSDTLDAFSIFDEEPVYTTGAPKASSDPGLVQSCLKNHVVVLTDGVSRTTDNLLEANGFTTDDPGAILASWVDGARDLDQASLVFPSDFIDTAAALYDMDLPTGASDDFDNNISTYIFGIQPDDEDKAYLESAATAGGGLYFDVPSAFYPFRATMIEALAAIAEDIYGQGTALSGSASKPVFNTNDFTADSVMYQSRFSTNDWRGELSAYNLDDITGEAVYPAIWNASEELPSAAARNIFTIGTGDAPIAFTFGNWGQMTAQQQADLKELPTGSALTEEEMIDYLRGSDTYAGFLDTDFRLRQRSKLPDFINSKATYVQAPNSQYANNVNGYDNFVTAQASRRAMIYIGGNDGMLHAFDAETGAEQWAYIPKAMFKDSPEEGMSALADHNYKKNHRYFVDGSVEAFDVFIDIGNGSAEWRTILIGTYRAGARGIFALDVTDPVPSSGSGVDFSELFLWEVSDTDLIGDLDDIGHIYGIPSVVLQPDGKWAVIFGNGYNGDGESGAFYALDATDGSLISTVPVASTSTEVNGLAEVRAVDLNGDNIADRAYAGDLLGHMYAFEPYDDSGTTKWRSVYTQGSHAEPLVSVGDPITTAPVLSLYSGSNTSKAAPEVVVLFGAGKLLEVEDVQIVDGSGQVNGIYGVFDFGVSALDKTDLMERTLTTNTLTRSVDNTTQMTSEMGWFFELPEHERVVVNSRLFRGAFFLSTMTPSDPSASECSLGGDSWLLAVDPLQGYAPNFEIIPQAKDTNNDGQIDEMAIKLPGVTTTPAILGNMMFIPGTARKGKAEEVPLGFPPAGVKILTWEEKVKP